MNCKLLPTVVMMLLIKVTHNIHLGNQNCVCVALWDDLKQHPLTTNFYSYII